jgi:hypothetical protein
MIHAGVHEEKEDKICHFFLCCILKFRISLTIRNMILLIICSNLPCWPKRIAGSPTNENEDLFHALFSIYGTSPNYYSFRSSFLNDNFSLHNLLPCHRHLLQQHLTLWTQVRLLFCKELEQ